MSGQARTPEAPATTAPEHPPCPGEAAPTPTGPVAEPAYGPTGAGSVVVDVGGNVGALVLYVPAEMAGQEIDISPRQATARRRHACVRARPGATGIRYAAVYAGLPAGDYIIWRNQQDPAATVTITGGQITTSRWQG
jgi:hypothetical protein